MRDDIFPIVCLLPDDLSPWNPTSICTGLAGSELPGSAGWLARKDFRWTRQDEYPSGRWSFLHGIRRIVRGHHERQSAIWLRLHKSCPAVVCHALRQRCERTECWPALPLTFPSFGASANHPDSTVDWSQYLSITGVPSFFHGNVPPYSESYVLSVQREIATKMFLSVSYVGTQAHHLLVLTSANPGNPALCLNLSQPNDVMPGTPTCGPFGESGTYTRPSGAIIQGTREPFSPQFAAVTYQKTIANSNYNALQVGLRRSSGPLEFMVGYTYSKSLDESSSLAEAVNPIDPRLSGGLLPSTCVKVLWRATGTNSRRASFSDGRTVGLKVGPFPG